MDSQNRTAKIKAVAQWLHAHDDIAIITHIQPDGDALGSALALMHTLHSMGKRAFVCDQNSVPDYLKLLPRWEEVFAPESIPFSPRAVLSVDCADEGRMGTAKALLSDSIPFAVIDHHETNPADFDAALVDGEAAATGVLVYEVLREAGVPLTKDIALCLYTAISTDTGNFSFSSTNPEALLAVSECLRTGLDISDLSYRLFRMKSAARTRLLGRALNNMEYLAGGRLALIRVRLSDFEACGAQRADTEGIVNYGIDTEGTEISILVTEKDDGAKFSLRSKGNINVAHAVVPLGGGGHAQAAGVMIHQPMEEAVQTVLNVIMPLL